MVGRLGGTTSPFSHRAHGVPPGTTGRTPPPRCPAWSSATASTASASSGSTRTPSASPRRAWRCWCSTTASSARARASRASSSTTRPSSPTGGRRSSAPGSSTGVDPERIALWGTSTSGGHVVQLASEDARIAAVVAQVPLVDGLAQLFGTPVRQTVRLLWAGLKDRIGAAFGRDPLLIPAGGRPGSLAAATSPDALSGLAAITPPKSTWRNAMVARFTLATAMYRPGRSVGKRELPPARVPRRRRPARASQAGAEDGASGRAGRAPPLPGRPFRDVLRRRASTWPWPTRAAFLRRLPDR